MNIQDLEQTCAHSVLCWLATTGPDGPNVSPKEMWVHEGNMFAIAHIASPCSVANIREDPRVCVSLLDIFRQRGHKLLGRARLSKPNESAFGERLVAQAGPDFRVLEVIEVRIHQCTPILAPSRVLFPERTDSEHITATQATYQRALEG